MEALFWLILFGISYIGIYFLADKIIDELLEHMEKYNYTAVFMGILILGIDFEESFASIISAINRLPYLSMGNLVGNTIVTLAISLGIPSLFMTLKFEKVKPIYLWILSSAVLLFTLGVYFGQVLFIVSIISLLLFVFYVQVTIKHEEAHPLQMDIRELFLLIILMVLLIIFGELMIFSSEQLIKLYNINESLFGLIILGTVTNAEELWLVVHSIRRGKPELGIYTVVGKILWNLTFVFGISGLLLHTYTSSIQINLSLGIFLLDFFLFLFLISKRKSSKLIGGSFLVLSLLFFLMVIGVTLI